MENTAPSIPHATIVTLGTEIISGAKLDTNSQWLSQQLSQLGIMVRQHLSVADDLEHIVLSIRSSMQHSQYILITGGLGPTLDDLTRQALADAFQVEQYLHEPSLEQIQARFARRHYKMPIQNRIQAMIPLGSLPIPNPHGTAPGIFMEYEFGQCEIKGQIFALPGVPSEMKSMFRAFVAAKLASSGRVIRQAQVHCFGLTESYTEELLGDITKRGRNPEVGITAHEATITLRLQAVGDSEFDCRTMIDETKTAIYEKIGDYIFGEDDDKMESIAIGLLKSANKTISVLELGTGGLLAQKFHRFDSCGDDFLGGTVMPADLNRTGTDREMSFEEQVEKVRCSLGSDLILAIDGWDQNEVHKRDKYPQVKILVSSKNSCEKFKATLIGVPELEQIRVVKIAMNFLIGYLKSLEENSR